MKNLKLLLLLLYIPIAASCNNDDDNNTPPPVNTTLEGSWKLINISGGFQGMNQDFEEGLITWNFDESEGSLTVVNNNPADVYDALGTGDYLYTVTPVESQSCGSTISVTQNLMIHNFGCMTLNGNNLTMSQIESDGFLLTFKR